MQDRLPGTAAALEIPEPDETPAIRRVEHPAIRVLEVPLEPMVWRRSGFNKKTGVHYTEGECRKRTAEIRMLWRGGRLDHLGAVPLGAHFDFVWDHPDSHYGAAGLKAEHVGTRPGHGYGDLDNLVKLVKDALQDTDKHGPVAYVNDTQIAIFSAEKRWAEPGERSMTRVSLWPI